jgi:hypothetical protein
MESGTEFPRRLILVVPAADQSRANAAAEQWDPAGGAETFRVPLSAAGLAPASHYGCSVQMREATYQAVAALVAAQFAGSTLREWDMDGDPDGLERTLSELGLKRIETRGGG